MRKLLVLSILFATFLLPVSAADGKNGRRALRTTMLWMLVAELAYGFLLYYVYPRLF